MKLLLFLLCFFIIDNSIHATNHAVLSVGHSLSFDQARLEDNAETKGFGYKTGNLLELERLCTLFNKQNNALNVVVPPFKGISSAAIINLLKKSGFDLATEWKAIIAPMKKKPVLDQQEEASNLDEPFVFIESAETLAEQTERTKQFPQSFLAARAEFEQKLSETLNRTFLNIPSSESLDKIFKTTGLDALLATSDTTKRFMVRSTGKEDTQTLANAGGNASVANVTPERQALFNAIKIVILSYFGMKSLTQRLGLGDSSLFSYEVFTPVLIQEMIGETDANNIPICGVMFTEEPEGGISWKKELDATKKIKTSGITIIQAAYGHNEAVVNSLIPVDTYLAMPNATEKFTIFPIIYNKAERLAPNDTSTELIHLRNPLALAQAPALSNAMLQTLKRLADALENYYGYPMDVEFVIKNSTISIVQARPIVHRKRTVEPSYLIEMPKEIQLFTGASIGVAGGAVRTIKNTDQIICARSIGEALKIYLSPGFNREAVKAIIVGAMAPSTSHEATTFRSEGKPVMFIQAWDEIATALKAEKQLLIDLQQNQIFVVDDTSEYTELLKTGWINYPTPSQLSIALPFFADNAVGSETILAKTKGSLSSIGNNSQPQQLKSLIHKLKIAPPDQVTPAVGKILSLVVNNIAQAHQMLTFDEDLTNQSNTIAIATQQLCHRVLQNMTIPINDPFYMRRLLPIKMLETLLLEQSPNDDIIGSLSFIDLIKTIKEEASLQPSQSQLEKMPTADAKFFYPQFKKIHSVIFNEQVRKDWSNFIDQLTQSRDANLIKIFGGLIAQLKKLNILPMWLHNVFAHDMHSSIDKDNINFKIITGWAQHFNESRDFITLMQNKKRAISQFNNNSFDDPNKFAANWKNFKALLDFFKSHDFNEKFSKSNALARFASCSIMNEFTDLFDHSIKMVKGSTSWAEKEKVETFFIMLREYFNLLESWVELVPHGAITYNSKSPLAQHLKAMRNVIMKTDFNKDDLIATPDFTTAAFTLGSGMNIVGEPLPRTGEDVFSIIHQSLVVVLGSLMKLNGGESLVRPTLLDDVENMLSDARKAISISLVSNLSLIGTEISTKGMQLHYNFPLKNHSCQFFIQFHKKTNSVDFTVQFYGHNPDRWFRIANFALLMKFADICQVKNFDINATSCAFTFVINADTDLVTLQKIITNMMEHTFDRPLDIQTYVDKISLPAEQVNKLQEKNLGKECAASGKWLLSLLLRDAESSYSEQLINVADLQVQYKNILEYWTEIDREICEPTETDRHKIFVLFYKILEAWNPEVMSPKIINDLVIETINTLEGSMPQEFYNALEIYSKHFSIEDFTIFNNATQNLLSYLNNPTNQTLHSAIINYNPAKKTISHVIIKNNNSESTPTVILTTTAMAEHTLCQIQASFGYGNESLPTCFARTLQAKFLDKINYSKFEIDNKLQNRLTIEFILPNTATPDAFRSITTYIEETFFADDMSSTSIQPLEDGTPPQEQELFNSLINIKDGLKANILRSRSDWFSNFIFKALQPEHPNWRENLHRFFEFLNPKTIFDLYGARVVPLFYKLCEQYAINNDSELATSINEFLNQLRRLTLNDPVEMRKIQDDFFSSLIKYNLLEKEALQKQLINPDIGLECLLTHQTVLSNQALYPLVAKKIAQLITFVLTNSDQKTIVHDLTKILHALLADDSIERFSLWPSIQEILIHLQAHPDNELFSQLTSHHYGIFTPPLEVKNLLAEVLQRSPLWASPVANKQLNLLGTVIQFNLIDHPGFKEKVSSLIEQVKQDMLSQSKIESLDAIPISYNSLKSPHTFLQEFGCWLIVTATTKTTAITSWLPNLIILKDLLENTALQSHLSLDLQEKLSTIVKRKTIIKSHIDRPQLIIDGLIKNKYLLQSNPILVSKILSILQKMIFLTYGTKKTIRIYTLLLDAKNPAKGLGLITQVLQKQKNPEAITIFKKILSTIIDETEGNFTHLSQNAKALDSIELMA